MYVLRAGVLQNHRPPTAHPQPTTDPQTGPPPTHQPQTTDHRPTNKSSTNPLTTEHRPSDHIRTDPPTTDFKTVSILMLVTITFGVCY